MNSKRKCANCKSRKIAVDMLIKGLQAFCDKDCLIDYATSNTKKLAEKGRKIERQRIAAKKKKFNLSDKTLRKKAAQNAFNAYIRLRDEKLPCISCGKPNDGSHQRHASHFISRAASSFLSFNELNVHASCAQCNNYMSGNIGKYRIALIDKIGIHAVEWLENQPRVKRYTCEELKSIEDDYKNKIKNLK